MKPLARYNISKPPIAWKHYSKKYVDNDSVKMILSLHKLEAQLRKEIAKEQIYRWSKEEIQARFG